MDGRISKWMVAIGDDGEPLASVLTVQFDRSFTSTYDPVMIAIHFKLDIGKYGLGLYEKYSIGRE